MRKDDGSGRGRLIEVDAHELKYEEWARDPDGPAPTAEAVYAEWLNARLMGIARRRSCRVRTVRRNEAWRGEKKACQGRSVILHGDLEVVDSSGFAESLAGGSDATRLTATE